MVKDVETQRHLLFPEYSKFWYSLYRFSEYFIWIEQNFPIIIELIDQMLENLFPCAIITPLDCFWEGSKLLGPEFPVPIPYVINIY